MPPCRTPLAPCPAQPAPGRKRIVIRAVRQPARGHIDPPARGGEGDPIGWIALHFAIFPKKFCKNFPLAPAADIQWPMVGPIAVGMGQGCTVSGHAVRNPATADRISASAVISGHVQWPRGRAEGGGAQKICAKILVLGAVPKCGGAWHSGAIGNSCQSVYALGRDGAA